MKTTEQQVNELIENKNSLHLLQWITKHMLSWFSEWDAKDALSAQYDNLCKRKKELDEQLDNLLKKQDDKQ